MNVFAASVPVPPVTVTTWPTFRPSVLGATVNVFDPAVSTGAAAVCAATGAMMSGKIAPFGIAADSVATPVPGT